MSRDTLIYLNFSWLKETLKPSGIYSCYSTGVLLMRLAFAGFAVYKI